MSSVVMEYIIFTIIYAMMAVPLSLLLGGWLRGPYRWWKAAALGAGFGPFFVATLATPLTWAGLGFGMSTWVLAYIFVLAIAVFSFALSVKRPTGVLGAANCESEGQAKMQGHILLGILTLIAIHSVLLHAAQAEFKGDTHFIWFTKGWTFLNQGSVYPFRWTHASSYPHGVPVMYAIYMSLGSGIGVAAWQAFMVSGFALALAALALERCGRMGGLLVFLFFQMLLLTWGQFPVHYQYGDLPLSMTIACGVVFLGLAFEKAPGAWLVALIILSEAALTKTNFIFTSVIIVFGATLVGLVRRKIIDRMLLCQIGLIITPALLLILLFYAVRAFDGGDDWVVDYAGHVLREEILSAPSPWRAYLDIAQFSLETFLFVHPFPGIVSYTPAWLARTPWALSVCAVLLPFVKWLRPSASLPALVAVGLALFTIFVTFCLAPQTPQYSGGYYRSIMHFSPLALSAAFLATVDLSEAIRKRLG